MEKRRLPKTTTIQIALMAEHPSSQAALDALYERIGHADDISDAAGIRPSCRSLTDIFKDDAKVPACRLTLEDTNEIQGPDDCDLYGFPKDMSWQYRVAVNGKTEDARTVCEKLCNLLCITCYMSEEYGQDLSFGKKIQPAPGTVPSRAEDVLRNIPHTTETPSGDQVLNHDEMDDIADMIRSCYESYKASNGESKDPVRFYIKVCHRYKDVPDASGGTTRGISRNFCCQLKGSTGALDIHYGKREIDKMGISDSALYKVFEHLLAGYWEIVIKGTYNTCSGHTDIESVKTADRPSL